MSKSVYGFVAAAALSMTMATAAAADIVVFTFVGPAISIGGGQIGTVSGSIPIMLQPGYTFLSGSVTYSYDFYVYAGTISGSQVSDANFAFPTLFTGYAVDGFNSNPNGFIRTNPGQTDMLYSATPWNYSINVQAGSPLLGASHADIDPTASVTASYTPSPPMPEPDTWALMILGLGGVGATMRLARRKPEATVPRTI